jgi:WD40 repeat protein
MHFLDDVPGCIRKRVCSDVRQWMICVQYMSGRKLPAVQLRPSDTVMQLRDAIQRVNNIERGFKLMHQQEVLRLAQRLEDVGLHNGATVSLVQLPDLLIAAAFPDGKTLLYNARTGCVKMRFRQDAGGLVAVAPQKSVVAVGSPRGPWVHMWSLQSGLRIQALSLEAAGLHVHGLTQEWASELCFSIDEMLLVVGTWGGAICAWSVDSGNVRYVCRGHEAPVRSLSVSCDGTMVASGSNDGTAKIWSATSGAQMSTFQPYPLDWTPEEPASYITVVRFSPVTKLLATAVIPRTIRLWCVESGVQKISMGFTVHFIKSMVFSPEGTLLAIAGRDQVLVYELERERWCAMGTFPVHVCCLSYSPIGDVLMVNGYPYLIPKGEEEYVYEHMGHSYLVDADDTTLSIKKTFTRSHFRQRYNRLDPMDFQMGCTSAVMLLDCGSAIS